MGSVLLLKIRTSPGPFSSKALTGVNTAFSLPSVPNGFQFFFEKKVNRFKAALLTCYIPFEAGQNPVLFTVPVSGEASK